LDNVLAGINKERPVVRKTKPVLKKLTVATICLLGKAWAFFNENPR
jgi:hypothetical protein